jgi:hypothetical protein
MCHARKTDDIGLPREIISVSAVAHKDSLKTDYWFNPAIRATPGLLHPVWGSQTGGASSATTIVEREREAINSREANHNRVVFTA